MIVDVFNEILTKLKTELVGVIVETSFNDENADYPFVVFAEKNNLADTETKDSGGYNHDLQLFQIDIFTIGELKRSHARTIRNQIDAIMSDEYGMNRNFSDEIPNFLDRSIYRYTLRYDCKIGKDKIIYRR